MELGLLLVDSKDTREMLLPSPKDYIAKIEEIIPSTIRKRTLVAKQWLVEQT
jgi:hypothetical protein